MNYYQIMQSLSDLTVYDLHRLEREIAREKAFRANRTMMAQLNLTEQEEGQPDFENELIKARRRK